MSIKLLDLIDFIKTYDSDQMREIRIGLERGLDVSVYADPKYNVYQMQQIRIGLERGLDVSVYADPKYNCMQMQVMRARLSSS